MSVPHNLRVLICMSGLSLGAIITGAELDQAIYVWQRQWTTHVLKAMERLDDRASHFQVQAAELRVDDAGRLNLHAFPVPWEQLKGQQLCAVVRCPVQLAGVLQTQQGRQAAADLLLEDERLAELPLQIDYDCPTSKLKAYAEWLALLRRRQLGLSITALPTWLGSPTVGDVFAKTDYYVLQVHGLERPTRIEAPATLLPLAKLPRWLEQAAAHRHPWYVALPTYGYLLHFDAKGAFIGLTAEGYTSSAVQGQQTRLLLADPDDVAGIVRQLQSQPPGACRGIVWFRLPVDSDRLNWSWYALRAVMKGRSPRLGFAARAVTQPSGVIDITVHNEGERNVIGGRLRLQLRLSPDATVLAFDALNDFDVTGTPAGTIILEGPAPALDEPKLAAWLRLYSGTLETVITQLNKSEEKSTELH